MMKTFKRSQRIAEQVQRDAADVIAAMFRDRGDMLVTVSGAEVTGDLRYAKIFYTVMGKGAEDLTRVQELLDQATGRIQAELAKRLRIRRMPEISLHFDKSLAQGLRVASLIDEVVSKKHDQQE
jgi:ribosome-binding factor A